ncbi:MAG: ATP-binding protein [Bacteroidetes bacterium]|jgi:hypothetical protein|nr:ATP-binding protein [Bacteroidota bacterium]
MDSTTFEKLLQKSEGRIIDFKREMYDFSNDPEKKEIHSYVKDVISFCNTIRNEPSYIIVGVKDLGGGQRDMVGLEHHIDEAELQAKVFNKVHPKPLFNYHLVNHHSKTFGVFEFPLYKYEMLLTSTVNYKQTLKIGTAYYRNGSGNVEIPLLEAIKINDWLRTLPAPADENIQLINKQNLLAKANDNNTKLSKVLSEVLAFAENYNKSELKEFCLEQIAGIKKDFNRENLFYRGSQIFFCTGHVNQINSFATIGTVANYLQNNNNCYTYKFLMQDSISNLESNISRTENDKGFVKINSTTLSIDPNFKPKANITIFISHNNYIQVYNGIRQALIELLLK